MRDPYAAARCRRWAATVVLAASLWCIGASVWLPPEMLWGGTGADVRYQSLLLGAYATAGTLGLVAEIVALRWRRVAQVLVAVAGVCLLLGFLALERISAVAVLSLGVTGALMLVSVPFFGPIPTPEEEGLPRAQGARSTPEGTPRAATTPGEREITRQDREQEPPGGHVPP